MSNDLCHWLWQNPQGYFRHIIFVHYILWLKLYLKWAIRTWLNIILYKASHFENKVILVIWLPRIALLYVRGPKRSWHSSFSVVTRYWGGQFLSGPRDFSLVLSVLIISGACLVSSIRGSSRCFPGLQPQTHETDHSPPFGDEVEDGGVLPPLSRVSMWHSYIIKCRNNFTFSISLMGPNIFYFMSWELYKESQNYMYILLLIFCIN